MTDKDYYAMRSRKLLEAAEAEMDPELQEAMLEQCFRLQRKAATDEMARLQAQAD